jgi:hypothetical protein
MYQINSIDIPNKFKERLERIINDLEYETGNNYQIAVNQFGFHENQCCLVREFRKRKNIIVYDMVEDYKGLEGIYETFDDIYASKLDIYMDKLIGNIYKKDQFSDQFIGKFRFAHQL